MTLAIVIIGITLSFGFAFFNVARLVYLLSKFKENHHIQSGILLKGLREEVRQKYHPELSKDFEVLVQKRNLFVFSAIFTVVWFYGSFAFLIFFSQ